MSDPMNQAKERFELQQLETAIKAELELDCQILPRSVETPIDTLVIKLEADEQERIRIASVMFFPLEDSDVESLKLLQFYCETPIRVESTQARATVAEFLSAVNLKIPVGTFCLNSNHEVVCKYVYALGKFKAIEPEEFLETFLLWMFAIDSMSGLIESVAKEEQSLVAATQHLDE